MKWNDHQLNVFNNLSKNYVSLGEDIKELLDVSEKLDDHQKHLEDKIISLTNLFVYLENRVAALEKKKEKADQ